MLQTKYLELLLHKHSGAHRHTKRHGTRYTLEEEEVRRKVKSSRRHKEF
jgi:hypothetical protein